MKKFVIGIIILLSITSGSILLKTLDQTIPANRCSFSDLKKDLREWDLVKTIPETRFYGEWQEYKLCMDTDENRIKLIDKNANVLWTKSNLRLGIALSYLKNNDKSINLDYSNVYQGTARKHERIPEQIYAVVGFDRIIDGKGNCLLMDETYNRYVYVDSSGTEVLLPPNTAGMEFLGLFHDKYLVFYQWDFLDYISRDEQMSEHDPHPGFNTGIKFTEAYNTCVIFDKSGNLLKQFKLPAVGVVNPEYLYFDTNINVMAYMWLNYKPSKNDYSQGYVLMSTSGDVYKTEKYSDPVQYYYLDHPVFSEDGKLWMPRYSGGKYDILETKTSSTFFSLEDIVGGACAISDIETGYLFFIGDGSAYVVDSKNKKMIFSLTNGDFRDPWISGNGKDIRITYQEEDKPAEIRFYHLKQ